MKINRARLKTIACAAISVATLLYMAAAFAVTSAVGRNDMCRGMRIEVLDDPVHTRNFVNAREIAHELGTLPERAAGMRLADIDTEEITRRLRAIDKIEDVTVLKTSDRRILVTVTPLIPVARVFEPSGSYYINKDNKRITASARYHVDVPVISGRFSPFDTVFTPASLLPMLDWLETHAKWSRLETMISADGPSDVILVPAITGHVINIGTPDNLDDKFARLERFYTTVMPVKGWTHYDTISVKWAGQVVATRRHKPVADTRSMTDDDDESADISTMLAAEGVAPGQALQGRKAKAEKPIPGAARADMEARRDTSGRGAAATSSATPAATNTKP